MRTLKMERGHVPYTSRGYRQDSFEAMGGNVVRGLIEAITNSDDSYALMRGVNDGKIWIGVDHSRKGSSWSVVVRDRAGGMSREDMLAKLIPIGGRSSGFERGEAVRGNRGRGAMDLAAFGEVVFESVKDGAYSVLKLHPNGDYDINERSQKATTEIRHRLHIPRGKNGTVVTIYCRRSFSCPRHSNLREQLRLDFQLRDIMSDPLREIILAKLNEPPAVDRLRYKVDPSLEVLLDGDIEVPEYGILFRMKVLKLAERCDAPTSDPTRPCGIIIKGRRAIYENTLFRFEGIPSAGWIMGRIECPYIDQLAFDFDELEQKSQPSSANNPIPIISRRRQGLSPDHPFVQALKRSAEETLGPLVERLEQQEREEEGQQESAETRRILDKLGREAARLLQQSLREIEDEEDLEAVGNGDLPPPLVIIPSSSKIILDETKTLSVVCDSHGIDEGELVHVEIEPANVVELVDGSDIPLETHQRRNDALSARVRLRALQQAEAIVTASVDGRKDVALVSGISPPPEPLPPEPPATLIFEKARYRVAFGKRKSLDVFAPTSLVQEHGDRLKVRSDTAGVIVRQHFITLVLDQELGFCVGSVVVEGRELGASGRVTASLNGVTAECRVTVSERDDGTPDLQIRFSYEDPGPHRGYLDPPDPKPDQGQTLWILVKHPSIRPILGERLEGEHSQEWKVLLPEIVADVLVRRLLMKKYPPSADFDAPSLYADHADWLTKLLPRLQRLSLAGATLVTPSRELTSTTG